MGLGSQEMLIIGIIAILLFGKRLPDVAKSLGKSYREFRRGLMEIQSSIDLSDSYSSSQRSTYRSSSTYTESDDDYDEPTAPKFEPPPSQPQPQESKGEAGSPDASSSV